MPQGSPYSKSSFPAHPPYFFRLSCGMDNFHDPTIMASVQVQLIVVKFWHATGGLYIWEFFTTLDYEWGVIRGDLPYRWTIWIYSFARVAALVGLILCFVIMDVSTPINCQPWVLFSSVGTLSCAFPSLRGERLSTSCLFPRFFYACLRPPLRY
jgi:hypothetical protein